jgi:spore coat polysaccharide biosynthesis protein SpsF (cytidylyltransferase family)
MADILGRPVLWRVVDRVRRAGLVDKVVVATTAKTADDEIALFCGREGIACFRGSEEDVLDRFYKAAKWIGADVVVRITAD